jgi:hypothetical protein
VHFVNFLTGEEAEDVVIAAIMDEADKLTNFGCKLFDFG